MKKTIGILSLMLWINLSLASVFPVVLTGESGRGLPAKISICLNSIGLLSCADIETQHEFLTFRSSNAFTYTLSGVKSNTPGIAIQVGSSLCQLNASGYCPIQFGPDMDVTVALVPSGSFDVFTLGGTVLGLNSAGLVLDDTVNNQSVIVAKDSKSFVFNQPIFSGNAYSVVVASQPQDSNCLVFNGQGTATTNVSNIVVACGVPSAAVGTQSGHVALSFDAGASWLLASTPSVGASVNGVFATNQNEHSNGMLYAASSDGWVYSSSDLGGTWYALSTSIDGTAVNGLYVVPGEYDTIYAVTKGGAFASLVNNHNDNWSVTHPGLGSLYSVFYNNTLQRFITGAASGMSYISSVTTPLNWTPLPVMPISSDAVFNVGLSDYGVMLGLVNGNLYAYASSMWIWSGQTLSSFYLNTKTNNIYVGSENGWVSLLNAAESLNQLGFVEYSPIRTLYFFD